MTGVQSSVNKLPPSPWELETTLLHLHFSEGLLYSCGFGRICYEQ